MKTTTRLNSLVNMMATVNNHVSSFPNDQELGRNIRESLQGKSLLPKWSVDELTGDGPVAIALFESLPHAKMYMDMISEVEKGEKKFCITDLGEAPF